MSYINPVNPNIKIFDDLKRNITEMIHNQNQFTFFKEVGLHQLGLLALSLITSGSSSFDKGSEKVRFIQDSAHHTSLSLAKVEGVIKQIILLKPKTKILQLFIDLRDLEKSIRDIAQTSFPRRNLRLEETALTLDRLFWNSFINNRLELSLKKTEITQAITMAVEESTHARICREYVDNSESVFKDFKNNIISAYSESSIEDVFRVLLILSGQNLVIEPDLIKILKTLDKSDKNYTNMLTRLFISDSSDIFERIHLKTIKQFKEKQDKNYDAQLQAAPTQYKRAFLQLYKSQKSQNIIKGYFTLKGRFGDDLFKYKLFTLPCTVKFFLKLFHSQEYNPEEVSSLIKDLASRLPEQKKGRINKDILTKNTVDTAKVALENIVEIVENKRAATIQDMQKIDDMMLKMRQQINFAAVQELLETMSKDPLINPKVVKDFEISWKNDGELLGVDIKQNLAVLDEKRRHHIILNAREISKKEEREKALHTFKEQLASDIKAGRMVVEPKSMAKRYEKVIQLAKKDKTQLSQQELKELQEQYKKIYKDALLNQTINSKQNHKKVTGGYVENNFLKLIGFGSENDSLIRLKRNQAELDCLKTLLQSEGLGASTIEKMQEALSRELQKARFIASGIPEKDVGGYLLLVEELEKGLLKMMEISVWDSENIIDLPARFPLKAKRMLLNFKAHHVSRQNRVRFFNDILKNPDLWKDVAKKSPEKIITTVRDTMRSLLEKAASGELYRKFEEAYRSHINFFKDYGQYLVKEMIQGQDDKDDILNEGVCLALAVRWINNELHNPHLSAEDFGNVAQIGEVTAWTRFCQLCSNAAGMVKKVFGVESKEHYGNRIIPENFRKKEGIERVDDLIEVKNRSKGLYEFELAFKKRMHEDFNKHEIDLRKKIEAELKSQNPHLRKNRKEWQRKIEELFVKRMAVVAAKLGTVLISLSMEKSGHAIYMRYQPGKNGTFRIGDPNVGLLEFKADQPEAEKKCFDCLNALVNVYYEDFQSIRVHRLIPSTKA